MYQSERVQSRSAWCWSCSGFLGHMHHLVDKQAHKPQIQAQELGSYCGIGFELLALKGNDFRA